jgi:GxxExxY protein
MDELFYKQEIFQLGGLCMEIHRELGKGHDEILYKHALVVELSRAGTPFVREKNYEITYKGVILPH